MKKTIVILTALITLNVGAETIKHGRVTDKGTDAPRRVWYPFVGFVDVNINTIYWLQIDNKWHRVTQVEHAKYEKGQFFSRKTNYDFYPQF